MKSKLKKTQPVLDRILPRLIIFLLSSYSAKNGKHQDSSQVRFANMRRSVSENEDGFEQKHQRKKTFGFPSVKKRYVNRFLITCHSSKR